MRRIPTGIDDLILRRGTGFYLLILPWLDSLYELDRAGTVLGGLAPLVPAVRRRLAGLVDARVVILAVWFLGLAGLPGLLQWLRVEPNEISLQRPVISHNIECTRRRLRPRRRRGGGERRQRQADPAGGGGQPTAAGRDPGLGPGLPGLLQAEEAMPEALRAHVRHPTDYLLAQGLVYAEYHRSDPAPTSRSSCSPCPSPPRAARS